MYTNIYNARLQNGMTYGIERRNGFGSRCRKWLRGWESRDVTTAAQIGRWDKANDLRKLVQISIKNKKKSSSRTTKRKNEEKKSHMKNVYHGPQQKPHRVRTHLCCRITSLACCCRFVVWLSHSPYPQDDMTRRRTPFCPPHCQKAYEWQHYSVGGSTT